MNCITKVGFFSLLLSCAAVARGESVAWTRQFGTTGQDVSYDVSADGLGNVFLSGYTDSSLNGPSGNHDAFVSKYDSAGSLLWIRQLGTTGYEEGYNISADGLGNVYLSGYTDGSLNGPNAGNSDAFVSKYDVAGSLLWTRQFGTAGYDSSHGTSADELGNVYVSGWTDGSLNGSNAGNRDAFVSKYDSAGSLLWTRQLGTVGFDASYGISTDGLGNVYTSGQTTGSLGGLSTGGFDAFVSKYDADGGLLWTRQLGTGRGDYSDGVSADKLGNVYISGFTFGSLGGPNAGNDDAFVSKYDSAGTLLWTRQLGMRAVDKGYAVSADGLGNVYISGYTEGNLGGRNAGNEDAFVSKYNAAGSLLWTRQLGTADTDISFGVSADGWGNVYFSGFTAGSLGGPAAGYSDAFVVKITDLLVPEPSTLLLAAMCLFGVVAHNRSQKN